MGRTLTIGGMLKRGVAVGVFSFSAAALHASPALALDDAALPTGGIVTGGSASFDYSVPDELHVYQGSDRAIIDWSSFNIGSGALTQFHQPGSNSIVVNRVTGNGDPTRILGTLRANGIVVVLDRNGVIYGENSVVDVGSIVTSTGSIDNAAFMAGNNLHLTNIDTGGSIINHGMISVADAGLAAFVAPSVVNSGIITAKLGRIQIGSGESATLDLYGDGLLEVAVSDEGMSQALANTGILSAEGGTIQITAAAAKGVIDSVINLDGVVTASSATLKGGKIVLGADTIHVAETAKLDASSTAGKGGEVILYANDTARIAGSIKASGSTDDTGGFIETSATNRVTIADTAHIDSGNGQWLIDPTNFTIGNSGGDITTATLAAQLALNNVTIETADAGSDAGDIFVQNSLTWTGNKTLSLKAHRNIEVNAAITNTTGGSLLLRADKTGSGTGTVIFGASGSAAMSGGGRTDLYYNPTAYTTPTNYSAKVTGTNTAWMLVNNVTQLQAMNTSLAGSYALGKDIDASITSTWNAGAGFNPIGNSSTKFTGKFDGLGHIITGLTINRPTTDNIALFGYTIGAAIRNVGLTGGTLTGKNYVGGLIGYNSNSTLTNSYSANSVTGTGSVGGLVGQNVTGGSVTNSYATGNVSGNNANVGGLIGQSIGGHVSGSYATGAVSGWNQVGGLVGYNNSSSSVISSYATGSVSGTGDNVGGLVGFSNNSSSINASYATGAVSSIGSRVGGLVGIAEGSSTISNSYATGNVSGTGTVGGLSGGIGYSSAINDSYATGNVTGTGSNVGGLVGNNYISTITRSYATGAVTGTTNVGGLVGNNGGTLTNSYWNTQTSGRATSVGWGTGTGGTGLTTAQMMQMASFSGWNIASTGGAGTIWRIYEGHTAPLLASFLTPLTVSAADMTITYNGTAFASGNATYSGLKSGDTAAVLSGTLAYGGTSQGATNAGTYGISLNGGLYSGQQGYDISYSATPAALTIAKRDITATVHNDTRTYGDANPVWDWTNVTWNNLAGGQAGSVLDALSVSGTADAASNAGSAQTITLSGFSDNNYNLTGYTAGTLTIGKRDITGTVHDDARAYGASNPIWDWTNVTWNNLAGGQNGSVLDALNVSSTADAAGNPGPHAITITGFSDNNYNLTGHTPGILTIGPKPVLLPADIIRIVDAKRAASTPDTGAPETTLVDTTASEAEIGSMSGCLAAMASGSCVLQ